MLTITGIRCNQNPIKEKTNDNHILWAFEALAFNKHTQNALEDSRGEY